MRIQPQLLTLHQLLKERLFRIPEYQRSYSWQARQRGDLFDDLNKVATSGEQHFMATVVGLRRGTQSILTNDFFVVEVVDGQQRLTTLVILLKAIERALDASLANERAVGEELRQLLVKPDELAPVLLQTNHDSSHHCVKYLRDGTRAEPRDAKTLADRCLLDAMAQAEAFVATWKGSRSLVELVALLKNKLTFIFHELDNEATVYTVFEVLNSRGLEVSWFDRLKSILMGIAFESKTGNEAGAIDELHRLWRDIYGEIGLRQGLNTETLRFAATLQSSEQPSRVFGEEDSVEALRAIASRSAKGVVEVSEWLLRVARAVDALWADRRRDGATRISQARLLAAAILLRDDLKSAEKEQLLGLWERVSFRIYGMFGKDARSKVGDYVRLAWRVAREKLPPSEIVLDLKEIGREYPIAGAVDQLRDTNCYSAWQQELRYLLFRYEEHLAASAGQVFDNEQWSRIWEATAAESIEHVQAQSKGSSGPTATGIFVHRLGNLMLLPPRLNSKLQDLDPDKKADAYVKTGLHQAVEVAARVAVWDRAAVVKREEELLAWAATHWAD